MWQNREAKICHECRKPRIQQRLKGSRAELLGQPLTVREFQVIRYICQGLLNKEIADKTHLVEGTIKVYVSQVLAKTGFTNRTQLAVWATQQPWYID